MPFKLKKAKLLLSSVVKEELERISRSRIEKASRVERAKILLAYYEGNSINSIAKALSTNRPKVDRCIEKALQLGALTTLDDLPRPGKPSKISEDAKAWLINLACTKPKDHGYSLELWTQSLLAEHARIHCRKYGHHSLSRIQKGTVSKILKKSSIRPHKASYLERRDPEFDRKMVRVLHVYKQVELIKENKKDAPPIAFLSYDEKPGIQAIESVAPDVPPVPGEYSTLSRDMEYIRHGTLSLLAGINLLDGHVHAFVADRHRSMEFVTFLRMLDMRYPDDVLIRIILDNHSMHVSKETRSFLATLPNRFELVFTPTHGSWLNIIESFFAKMTKTFLRGLRVESKEDLRQRLISWICEINAFPVQFKWKYGLDKI